MPLYMDIHQHVEGLTADAIAQAHEADLQTQEKHGVKYLRYWFDENTYGIREQHDVLGAVDWLLRHGYAASSASLY